ncbi:MAG: hypothetical protein J5738_08765 [Lachnospiraceae bacterium]|nr:hypothetical protein [Lachnospiraceae bacterium]
MKYYRVHTDEIAWLTKQPRGIFTAVWKLIEAGVTTEEETAEYWRNRRYFEEALPLPPYYEAGNPDGAVTWFKDTEQGNDIWRQMTFYRAMGAKYGVAIFISECDEIPGEVIYEDDFQIAVKGQKPDVKITTKPLEE